MASAGQFIKRLLQLARDRPSLSAADGAEVDLAQPNHLGNAFHWGASRARAAFERLVEVGEAERDGSAYRLVGSTRRPR